jgi:RNA polymerase sigma-70 factor (ECF subfamily)
VDAPIASGADEGGRAEFESLTRPLLPSLHRFALHSVRHRHDAEELVQETCLHAYRAFDGFVRGTSFRAWIFRILANTITDWRRRNARRPVGLQLDDVELELGALPPTQDRLGPDQHLVEQSMADALRSALSALPQDWQAVVQLCCVEGFAYKEIADILGCPVGTVMSRLHRARQVLRQRLAVHIEVSNRPGLGHRAPGPRQAGERPS